MSIFNFLLDKEGDLSTKLKLKGFFWGGGSNLALMGAIVWECEEFCH